MVQWDILCVPSSLGGSLLVASSFGSRRALRLSVAARARFSVRALDCSSALGLGRSSASPSRRAGRSLLIRHGASLAV